MSDWGLDTPAALVRQQATRARVSAGLAAVTDARDRVERMRAWAGVATEAEALAEVAVSDAAWVVAQLVAVSGVAGMGEPVRALQRSVDKVVRSWEKRIEAATRVPVSPRGIGEAGRPPELPAACIVPEPYAVSSGGVWRRVVTEEAERIVPVTSAPLYVVGRLEDADTRACWLDLAWPDDSGAWRHHTMSRIQASDSRGVVGLAEFGAPVHSGNAREVVAYLATLESDWRYHLPVRRTLSHCGWAGRGAMVGTAWHGEGEVSMRPPDGFAGLVEAIRQSGTLAGWTHLWEQASGRPIPCLAVYASVASILLTPMGAPGCVLDVWSRTSVGKTITLRLAASVWGDPSPNGLVRQWGSTLTWRERAAEVLGSIPLLLDDTRQMPERDRETLPVSVYNHAFGMGRGRGRVEGVQHQAAWRSWLISTGESPVLRGGGNDGARARCLSLEGSPFADRASAVAVEVGADVHYGHLGPMVAAWAVSHLDALPSMYQERVAAWSAASAGLGPIAQRLSASVAGLDVAATVIHDHLGIPVPTCDPWALALAGLQAAESGADQPLSAWRAVYARGAARGLAWWGRGKGEVDPPGGWLGAWDSPLSTGEEPPPGILPQVLRAWLVEDGHDYDATVAEWVRRGWVERDTEGRTTKPRKVGHSRPRVVTFTPDAMGAL